MRLLKVSRLKHKFQARYEIMVIMVSYNPPFNFVYKLQGFQGFLRRKKKKRTTSFGIKFGSKFSSFYIVKKPLKQGLSQSPTGYF